MDRINHHQFFTDVFICCVDCGFEFLFSAGEQQFFESKGLSPPKRCPKCRLRRRLTLVREVDDEAE